MQIEYRKLSELHPHPSNPRKVTKEGIEQLAKSIEENPDFFEARPILLSNRTGKLVIIGGERRYEAAKFLNQKEAPTILMEGLTEEQEYRFLYLDNVHSGTWDIAKLEEMKDKWDMAQLHSWGVPITPPIDEAAVNALFVESNQSAKTGTLHIHIEVPNLYEGNFAEIKESINAALSEYPKVIIK